MPWQIADIHIAKKYKKNLLLFRESLTFAILQFAQ